MAEKRRGKGKKREDEIERPTKEEYAVAKFLRFNVPCKEGKLVGMTVNYFIASKAVDALLDSHWAKAKEPLFTTRPGVVDYCNRLLAKGMFHRAARSERKRDKKKSKKVEAEETPKEEEKKKKAKKSKEKEETEKESKTEDKTEKEPEEKSEQTKDEGEKKEDEKKEEEKKKKKKARLEMHDSQVFKDGDEVYVWIYDPVPLKTFIIGLLLVLGAIAVCLFPLWPPEVRLGVYYLSLAAAGFVGFILVLCIVRLILFCFIWLVTVGKHHFWFLPNLTEDVGFFDSFRPLYKHEINTRGLDEKEEKSNKTKKEEADEKPEEEKDEDEEEEKGGGDVGEEESGKEESGKESGSDPDNDNGYEMVEKEELEEEEEEEGIEDTEPTPAEEKKNQ